MEMKFLWTSGWDSTFRIIQLFNSGVIVQPIYVIDPGRKSANKEIQTINLLTEQIKNKFPLSTGDILPVKLIPKNEIKHNLFLKVISKVLRKFYKPKLGKQYYWLACLSRSEKIGFELCFHKENRTMLIPLNEITEIIDENHGRNWVVNTKTMNLLKRQIFKNMRFPLMYISKLEMKDYAEKNNFLDIMNNTWFCHRSENKPCGECAPCKQYIIDGFGDKLN